MKPFAVTSVGVAAVRRRPSHAAEQLTQVLLGEGLRVLARSREIQQLSSDTASRVPHAVRDTAADDDDDPDDPPTTSSPLRRVR